MALAIEPYPFLKVMLFHQRLKVIPWPAGVKREDSPRSSTARSMHALPVAVEHSSIFATVVRTLCPQRRSDQRCVYTIHKWGDSKVHSQRPTPHMPPVLEHEIQRHAPYEGRLGVNISKSRGSAG